jgi:ArsR family transcriptional regulator
MDSLARILKTLGHPDRLRILALLSHGDFTVSEITQVLGLSQPRVTQYINTLEKVGIIERLKEGSWVFSRLRRQNAAVWAVVSTVLSQLPEEDATLRADRRRLEDIKAARADAANAFFAQAANDQNQLGIEYLPREDIEAELRAMLGEGPHGTLIDLGTGSGRILNVLSDLVSRGIGIDNNRDMLGVARHGLSLAALPHMRVQQGDLHNTNLSSESANVVTLHQVLHYLETPDDAIREAARLLEGHGNLIIIDFAAHKFEDFRERFAHRRLGFSDVEMQGLLKSNNLDLAETRIVKTRASYPDVKLWRSVKRAANMKEVS